MAAYTVAVSRFSRKIVGVSIRFREPCSIMHIDIYPLCVQLVYVKFKLLDGLGCCLYYEEPAV